MPCHPIQGNLLPKHNWKRNWLGLYIGGGIKAAAVVSLVLVVAAAGPSVNHAAHWCNGDEDTPLWDYSRWLVIYGDIYYTVFYGRLGSAPGRRRHPPNSAPPSPCLLAGCMVGKATTRKELACLNVCLGHVYGSRGCLARCMLAGTTINGLPRLSDRSWYEPPTATTTKTGPVSLSVHWPDVGQISATQFKKSVKPPKLCQGWRLDDYEKEPNIMQQSSATRNLLAIAYKLRIYVYIDNNITPTAHSAMEDETVMMQRYSENTWAGYKTI